MGVSYNWLKKYVNTSFEPEELAHRLTMAGVAIEGIERIDEDAIFELDLTPNRGDCLGLINLAREVAALTGQKVNIPTIKIDENDEDINDYISVSIESPDLCKRYAARLIKNCIVKPSPGWMQEALINSGIRPINNIVDITNYVLLETNQPLHAFDYNLLGPEKRIVVRTAKKEEKITTLDGIERNLEDNMLVIADGDKAVALAGIMGGQNTEINDHTTSVLLESANFLYTSIRKTSRKLALRSDSSVRFEKGADVNGVIYAVNRAAQLIQELAGGEVVKGICDVYPEPVQPKKITLRPDRINYLLATELNIEEIKGYLDRLEFAVKTNNNVLEVTVPTYRPDIQLEVDLIEEVARLHGYENIPTTLPYGQTSEGGQTHYQKFRDLLKNIMSSSMYEVINYSFISPSYYDKMLIPGDSPLKNVVKVANPLSEEQSIMRTTLLPGLVENVKRNLSRQNENLSFFELGTVFYPAEQGLPEEKMLLSGIIVGNSEVNWLKVKIDLDFYYIKGIVEDLLKQIGMSDCEFLPGKHPSFHPGRNASIVYKGKQIGVIGELHPTVLQNFDIKVRTCAFEMDVESLFDFAQDKILMEQITKYPVVERDIAILIEQKTNAAEIINIIKNAGNSLLREVVVFDLYFGEQIPVGYKSMGFKLVFQSTERTLTEDEVSKYIENILAELKKELKAELR